MNYLKLDIFSFYRFFNVSFFWKWTGATLAGFLLSLLWIEIGHRGELGMIEGIIGGTLIGLSQALILSQYFSDAWVWILINLISWGLLAISGLGAIGWVAPNTSLLTLRLVYGASYGAITGLWLGGWQWLFLRNYFHKAWYWIWLSILIWSFGLSMGWIVGGLLRSFTRLFVGEVIGLGVTWIVVGLMSGVAMIKVSRTNLST